MLVQGRRPARKEFDYRCTNSSQTLAHLRRSCAKSRAASPRQCSQMPSPHLRDRLMYGWQASARGYGLHHRGQRHAQVLAMPAGVSKYVLTCLCQLYMSHKGLSNNSTYRGLPSSVVRSGLLFLAIGGTCATGGVATRSAPSCTYKRRANVLFVHPPRR